MAPNSPIKGITVILIFFSRDFSLESLVEMFALLLEATNPESNTWRELASCFLKLYQHEEDRLSVCLNGNEGEQIPKLSVNYNKMPKFFTEGKSRKVWRLRCKCWLKRHSAKKMLASEIASESLESWLMPLKLPHSSENFVYLHRQILNNHYNDAVKCLQLALHSTPHLLAALLPLVQLLLIGGQVNEALSEVEKFCNNSRVPFPFRIRASLLECFYSNDSVMLSTCFEETLKKDPTCCHSLARLVSMQQNEVFAYIIVILIFFLRDYSLEYLVEMIALHLEATNLESNTWRVFASCFLKLYQHEEDRLSVCLNRNEGEQIPKLSVNYNKMPKLFTEGKSRKVWRLCCKCWLKRHFAMKMLASEMAS
ncbi:TATA box-binding protein-associated factor RNA polymerase I subunit A - like 1, partial [Theobroma cacao]